MSYQYAVFIGRFQPFHLGHLSIIQGALEQASTVLVFVGGAGGARRPRNPWTFAEREKMILASLPICQRDRVRVIPLYDKTYNDTAWIESIQANVALRTVPGDKIALVGRKKDESGYYLDMFPQWASIAVSAKWNDMDATDARKVLFQHYRIPRSILPAGTVGVLEEYIQTDEYKRMVSECHFINDYRIEHDNGEYPRNNVTADAVVIQSGHILLVKRAHLPGAGRMALPGGHVNAKETPINAMIRELREEAGLEIDAKSVTKMQVFDDPYRSDLARTYTFAYLVRLDSGRELAKITAGSDAEAAQWVPLNQLVEENMFDDHYHIIHALLGTS